MHVSTHDFAVLGSEMLKKAPGLSLSIAKRRFRALFGASPTVCATIWTLISNKLPKGSKPKHLLWACLFLKIYATEQVNSVITGADPKTFRKWVWVVLRLIASQRLVSTSFFKFSSLSQLWKIYWKRRRIGKPIDGCYVSVDGTDFKIQEPTPFSRQWYSHKFKGAGLRYEIAVSFKTCEVVWATGPYPCGSFPDLRIFRLKLKHLLAQNGEKAIADKGYRDPLCVQTVRYPSNLACRVRARHESINGRLKNFFVLSQTFRHPLNKHATCFFAVLNLTHLLLLEDPLFDI